MERRLFPLIRATKENMGRAVMSKYEYESVFIVSLRDKKMWANTRIYE